MVFAGYPYIYIGISITLFVLLVFGLFFSLYFSFLAIFSLARQVAGSVVVVHD